MSFGGVLMKLTPEEQQRWNEHQLRASRAGMGHGISLEKEQAIVNAWKETPTIANVTRTAGTGAAQAYRVLRKRGLM
jgi:hypothetical protein